MSGKRMFMHTLAHLPQTTPLFFLLSTNRQNPRNNGCRRLPNLLRYQNFSAATSGCALLPIASPDKDNGLNKLMKYM